MRLSVSVQCIDLIQLTKNCDGLFLMKASPKHCSEEKQQRFLVSDHEHKRARPCRNSQAEERESQGPRPAQGILQSNLHSSWPEHNSAQLHQFWARQQRRPPLPVLHSPRAQAPWACAHAPRHAGEAADGWVLEPDSLNASRALGTAGWKPALQQGSCQESANKCCLGRTDGHGCCKWAHRTFQEWETPTCSLLCNTEIT